MTEDMCDAIPIMDEKGIVCALFILRRWHHFLTQWRWTSSPDRNEFVRVYQISMSSDALMPIILGKPRDQVWDILQVIS